jgi:hypothetical protein
MNALDLENSSNCWNSEGSTADEVGNAAWFVIDFKRNVYPTRIKIQFQAGFCAESTAVYAKTAESDWVVTGDNPLEWDDVHEVQTRELGLATTATAVKLVLNECTDFYDRVTIYRLEIWGREGVTTAQTTDNG